MTLLSFAARGGYILRHGDPPSEMLSKIRYRKKGSASNKKIASLDSVSAVVDVSSSACTEGGLLGDLRFEVE